MKPAYLELSPVNIRGIQTNRLMIVLKTNGCEYAKRTGGCTMCGFMNHAEEDMTTEKMLKQLEYSLGCYDLGKIGEVDLLTLGSFFNDNEVSSDFRVKSLKLIASKVDIKRVSIESRAEYVTTEKLSAIRDIFNKEVIFEVGIGLESSDDYIRNKVLNKGLTKKLFEIFVSKLKVSNFSLLVYLLIKPQGLTEQDAIADAVNSAKYVFDVAKKNGLDARVAFEPVFVCDNTPLNKLFEKNKYKLVNLWSVIEVIKKTSKYGELFIGLSDENLSDERMPFSCGKCSETLRRAITQFNTTQNINSFNNLDCECKNDYEYNLKKGLI